MIHIQCTRTDVDARRPYSYMTRKRLKNTTKHEEYWQLYLVKNGLVDVTLTHSRSPGAVRGVHCTFSIDGLHDAVRTYARTIFSKSLGFLLHSPVWRKTTKNAKTFDLLHGRIWNFIRLCVCWYSCNSVAICDGRCCLHFLKSHTDPQNILLPLSICQFVSA